MTKHRMAGPGVTSIRVGVLFSGSVVTGNSFHINALTLTEQASDIGYKLTTTNPDGKKSVAFVDIEGRTLATAAVNGSTYDHWSYSYYNDINQVVATVAPQGITTATTYPHFTTLYKYDHLGRVIETTSTDEGTSRFVYSTDGKIRFSQNAEQALTGRFSYTNYDAQGRLIESGEYIGGGTNPFIFQPATTQTPATRSVLNLVDNVGHTGVSWKVAAQKARCVDYAIVEYDRTTQLPAGQTKPTFTYGQVTKTESAYDVTWYSYTEAGQLLQTIQSTEDLGIETVDYEYDFSGNVTAVIARKGVSGESFYHHYEYDADQRLHKVLTSVDGTNKTLQATYYYYLHGPLKRVELATNLQGIDYVYNIDGSLKMINHSDKDLDPGQDGSPGAHSSFKEDVFGQVIDYYGSDYTGAGFNGGNLQLPAYADQFGGAVKAIRWHSPSTAYEQKAYAYSYDPIYQLTDARWGNVTASGSTYSFTPSTLQAYRESPGSFDKNGNIQSMLRKDVSGDNIADYSYAYSSNTQYQQARAGNTRR